MVDYFANRPGELPGGDESDAPDADSSTWRNMEFVANRTVNDCVLGKGELGWQMTGKPRRHS